MPDPIVEFRTCPLWAGSLDLAVWRIQSEDDIEQVRHELAFGDQDTGVYGYRLPEPAIAYPAANSSLVYIGSTNRHFAQRVWEHWFGQSPVVGLAGYLKRYGELEFLRLALFSATSREQLEAAEFALIAAHESEFGLKPLLNDRSGGVVRPGTAHREVVRHLGARTDVPGADVPGEFSGLASHLDDPATMRRFLARTRTLRAGLTGFDRADDRDDAPEEPMEEVE